MISGIVRLRAIMTMVLVIKTSLLYVLGRTWNLVELFGTACWIAPPYIAGASIHLQKKTNMSATI